MNTNCFFDRLDQVVSAVVQSMQENRATLAADETLADINKEVSYGQTLTYHFTLDTYKGKGTRRGLTVTIYRTDTGRYELTHYYL